MIVLCKSCFRHAKVSNAQPLFQAFASGVNLVVLQNDVDYHIRLNELHKDFTSKAYVSKYHETISLIINKDFSLAETTLDEDIDDPLQSALQGFSDIGTC
jgi:hypothetical protein